MAPVGILDNTPTVVGQLARDERELLLARLRFNRLLDNFLGISTFPVHLLFDSPFYDSIGPEVEELHFGIAPFGDKCMVIVLSERWNGSPAISKLRASSEVPFKYSHNMRVHFILAHQTGGNCLALIELDLSSQRSKVKAEKHYEFIKPDELNAHDYVKDSLRFL